MSDQPYCTCKNPKGYTSLHDDLNTFICGECLKPSWLVYLSSEKFCDECGCSIFTFWCSTCSACLVARAEWWTDLPDDDRSALESAARHQSGDVLGWAGFPEMTENRRRYLERLGIK